MKSARFLVKNKWWASPFNDLPEVYKATRVNTKAVGVRDLTFCDWGASYGVRYSVEDVLQIVELLGEIGVKELEIGAPDGAGIGKEEILRILAAYPDTVFHMRAKASKAAVDAAVDCGAAGVVLEAPLGYPRLRYQLNVGCEAVAEKCLEILAYAKERGRVVTLAPYDIARAQPGDFEGFLKAIAKAPYLPDYWRIDDSTGSALPEAIRYLVARSQKLLKDVPVQICVSNDTGLALASTLSALMAGAKSVCASVNGLGKRAGIAALDEVLVCQEVMLGGGRYQIDKLFNLGVQLEQITGLDTPATKPFMGMRAYYVPDSELSGATYHPLHTFSMNPELLGRKPQRFSPKTVK